MSASGPHILVTGSTRGIGAAIVEVLSGRGARVVGHGRSTEGNVLGEDLEAAGAGARLWTQALARLDGRVGAGGIGALLSTQYQAANYPRIGVIVVGIVLTVAVVDWVSGNLRRRLA